MTDRLKERLKRHTVDEGYSARAKGIPLDRNPYIIAINPDNWQWWRRGWKEHEEEHPDD